jgi:hypothetical protein
LINTHTLNESVLSYGNLDYLTINKVYESFYISGTMTESNAYSIICDDGLERKLIANRFVTLEVHREQMLNKILK